MSSLLWLTHPFFLNLMSLLINDHNFASSELFFYFQLSIPFLDCHKRGHMLSWDNEFIYFWNQGWNSDWDFIEKLWKVLGYGIFWNQRTNNRELKKPLEKRTNYLKIISNWIRVLWKRGSICYCIKLCLSYNDRSTTGKRHFYEE